MERIPIAENKQEFFGRFLTLQNWILIDDCCQMETKRWAVNRSEWQFVDCGNTEFIHLCSVVPIFSLVMSQILAVES